MAFKITDPTGFIETGGINPLPVVSITSIESDKKLGLFAKPTSILWRRNSAFSTATIEIPDARVSDLIRLGSSTGIDVGSKVVIKSGEFILFQGYVMKQKMNAKGGTGTSKTEAITLECVDYKFDLYREVIFGQIGVQANGTTGEEASEGGLYGGGVGWFSAMKCVFNDRTFAKNQESASPKSKIKTPLGNSRLLPDGGFSATEATKPGKCFDGNYHALNKESGDPIAISATRNKAWSAWDMINYIMAYCYDPPFAKAGVLSSVQPKMVDPARIVLGSAAGLDEVFPANIDVNGSRAHDAITKICQSVGYSWWLEPPLTGGASKMVFWRTGSTGPKIMEFYMGPGGSGVPRGVYRTLGDGPIAYPLVDATRWNVDDLTVDIDYTTQVGTLIGTTNPIRVQTVFHLVKGWTNKIFYKIVKKIVEDIKELPDSGRNSENTSYTYISGKDATTGKTIRQINRRSGNPIQINQDAADEIEDPEVGDSLKDVFRRWITDDTGMVNTPGDKERAPYKFHVAGLSETNGSLYMVRPRPFLSQNISGSTSGDKNGPQIGFPKFQLGQVDEGYFVDLLPDEKRDKREGVMQDAAKIDRGGKTYYPFGSKRGQVRILRDTGGFYIDGGFLDLQNITIDPKTNKVFIFHPAALAAIEHDQSKIETLTVTSGSGKLPPSRRWIDGRRFLVDRIYAIKKNEIPSPKQVLEGAAAKVISDGVTPIELVDESDQLAKQLDADKDFYKSPKVVMRARIPTLTRAYLLGDKIKGVEGRLTLSGEDLAPNAVVGVQFDLNTFTTVVSVESEILNASNLKTLAQEGG